MLGFDKATYSSLLFSFILLVSFNNSLRGTDVLLFLEFINIVSVVYSCGVSGRFGLLGFFC